MTDDKLYTSLSVNTIMAKLTNHVQRTRPITSLTDKHYSLDSEDDFRSGSRNVSHHQQFFSELPSPGPSHYTNLFHRVCTWRTMLAQLWDSANKCIHPRSNRILELGSYEGRVCRRLSFLLKRFVYGSLVFLCRKHLHY